MANYTLIARINAGNGKFPFVSVQYSKNHRPIPIEGATYYLRPTSRGKRTPVRIGKDVAVAHTEMINMDYGRPLERPVVPEVHPQSVVAGTVSRKTVEEAALEYIQRSRQKSRKTYLGYVPRAEGRFIQGFARKSLQRVFKEGRKYGIGAIVVSQRPSELDETILSQCGTFFALRLTNAEDQGRVKSTVPDALSGLIDLLPALRTGEAIVLGEAVPLPCRVRLPLVEPRPRSDDPKVGDNWRNEKTASPDYAKAVTSWRVQEQAKPAESIEQRGANDG